MRFAMDFDFVFWWKHRSFHQRLSPLPLLLILLLQLASFRGSSFVRADTEDGATLLEIKKSFRDVDNVLRDWTDSSFYCYWKGVTCDNITLDMIALNLSSLNLHGEISPVIGYLMSLVSLDLQGNHLTGQIPVEIGGCLSLEELVLKNNKLTGPIPYTLAEIPNLKILDLFGNKLSGEIPEVIYWSRVLQYIGLRDNHLTGTLSSSMCQLTELFTFDVKFNKLTGSIPENIGNCSSLQILDLSYNQLTGEIPPSIGFLQVATLSLQGNKFTGQIPTVFGLMQALVVLDLGSNLLSGPIPSVLGNLAYTVKLYLNGNNLTGSIPPELGNMSMLNYMGLDNNLLTGQIPPELGKLTNLYYLNLANNKLEGAIPENFSSCTNLNDLDLHGNWLNGTIPPSFERLKSMTNLTISSNKLAGPFPIVVSQIANLDTLDLSDNMISGAIPSSIGDLEHLLKLNLSKNHLTGHIPAEFGNLKSIMSIDLSYNHLSGPLPQELGQLQNLDSLRAENNNLTGDILFLSDSYSLTFLNVSNNNLAGDIPISTNVSNFQPDSFLGNQDMCGYLLKSSCYTSQSSELHKATILKVVVLGTAAGILLIFAVVLAAVWKPHIPANFLKGSFKKSVSTVNLTSPKLVILNMNMALHVYDDIMKSTENLSAKYIIGHGTSSTVYKCTLKNSKPVAIKRLYTQYPHSLKQFETELETIGCVKHRNLVSLQGYSLSPSGNLLFYDYMENGSLWDILHGSSKKQKLDWNARLKIALGAAQGLAYLHHDCSPRIIHRDVKSPNILLDKDFEAHLADFGIAKSMSKSHSSTCIAGSIGYIDPEYAETSRLTEKSDVYSYGVVFLELLTGRKVVDDDSNLHQLVSEKSANDAVMEIVDPDISATCEDLGAVKKAFQLAFLCTRRQSSDRPPMHEVVHTLGSLVSSVTPDPPTHPSLPPPPAKACSYLDEYSNLKNASVINHSSLSTSDAQLLLHSGEVISQTTESVSNDTIYVSIT